MDWPNSIEVKRRIACICNVQILIAAVNGDGIGKNIVKVSGILALIFFIAGESCTTRLKF